MILYKNVQAGDKVIVTDGKIAPLVDVSGKKQQPAE